MYFKVTAVNPHVSIISFILKQDRLRLLVRFDWAGVYANAAAFGAVSGSHMKRRPNGEPVADIPYREVSRLAGDPNDWHGAAVRPQSLLMVAIHLLRFLLSGLYRLPRLSRQLFSFGSEPKGCDCK